MLTLSLRTRLATAMLEHKNNVAIIDEKSQLTYGELHSNAKLIGHKFKIIGLRKNDIIVLIGEKSPELLSWMIACLLYGTIFVICPPDISEHRLAEVTRECQASMVYEVGKGIKKLITTPNSANQNSILIYYTSGSTGKPKAIEIHEYNINNFVRWAISTFAFTDRDAFCAFAPWFFDLSILDIFAALLSGASIHCVPSTIKAFPYAIARWLNQHNITVVYMVPTVLRALIRHGQWCKENHSALRCILFAGENYPLSELIQLRSNFPNQTLANLYGPTETNVCSWYEIPSLNSLVQMDSLPIGSPLPNMALHVVDICGETLNRIGDEGELICTGPAVCSRYLNTTNSAFYIDKGMQAYRTGDLVKITKAGLILTGRKDRQIKFRGYRIDSCEIEACLRQFPTICEAAVCAIQNELVAFVSGKVAVTKSVILNHCKQLLPSYCCPTNIVIVDKVPLTPTEKIDYQTLIRQYNYTREGNFHENIQTF